MRWVVERQRLDRFRLRLETVQTHAAYEVLVDTGRLHGDPVLAERDFADAYAWLSREMDRRRVPPVGQPGMIWAWARIGRRELMRGLHLARGDMLLTLDVPADRVLLHGFGDWHAVLNRSLLIPDLPDETAEDYSRRAEPLWDDFDRRLREAGVGAGWEDDWPPELRREVEASWSLIFEPSSWHPRIAVQATLREVVASDVVEAVRVI
jgi:hypothetical protein